MKKLALVLAVAFVFGGALFAQGGGGGPGGGGGGGGYPGGGKNSGPKAPDDPNNKGRNGGPGGQGGQGGADYWKKQWEDAVNNLGWGENGDEVRVEPGQTTPDKDKETWLETEAVKLGITEKKPLSDFKKAGLKVWRECEAEDQKFAAIYKANKDVKDADKRLEEPRKKHQEALKKIWDKSDADMTKKTILNEEQLKTWQEDTKKMRTQTATDKSAEQDKIRARKIEELRKQWADYGKGDTEKKEPEKKAKKKEEGEEEKKPAEGEKKPEGGSEEKK